MADCSRFHEMISCLTDGELSDIERAELDLHISKCEGCRALLDIYQMAFTGNEVEPPRELASGAMLKIRAAAAKKKRSIRKQIMRYAAVAASFAIILFTVPMLTNSGSPSDFAASRLVTTEMTAADQNSGCTGSYDPTKYSDMDYLASVKIDGELPELLQGYEKTYAGNGSYTIEVRSYLMAYLNSLGYTPTYNEGSESNWSLVIYNPTGTAAA